ncbi:MAG TPA: YebC/PmpR family DNA-binding transcriptional regulator [Verrucomicrobiae bacterium]|nr:YebC/PmpR family DNA-binding transcriptional regulator [Verrucomicrobiae bacterium]
MSGHSKWAGIKHRKAAVDAKRANIFTKLANNITIAARNGGDPSLNPSLRLAMDKARAANMPKDNVERAIKRGTGELGGAAVEELLYEGFGPGNVAMLVAVLTDNRNRSNADVRTLFAKNGGRLAEGGGVAYQFTQRGVIRAQVPAGKAEAFEEACIEGGAEDYRLEEGFAVVYTATVELHTVKDALVVAGFTVDTAEIEYVANTPVEVGDEDMEKVIHLIDLLEEYDDVTSVYTNLPE